MPSYGVLVDENENALLYIIIAAVVIFIAIAFAGVYTWRSVTARNKRMKDLDSRIASARARAENAGQT